MKNLELKSLRSVILADHDILPELRKFIDNVDEKMDWSTFSRHADTSDYSPTDFFNCGSIEHVAPYIRPEFKDDFVRLYKSSLRVYNRRMLEDSVLYAIDRYFRHNLLDHEYSAWWDIDPESGESNGLLIMLGYIGTFKVIFDSPIGIVVQQISRADDLVPTAEIGLMNAYKTGRVPFVGMDPLPEFDRLAHDILVKIVKLVKEFVADVTIPEVK